MQILTAILAASLLALPPQAAGQAPRAADPATAPQFPNLAPQGTTQTPSQTPLPVESLIIYILEGQNEIHDIRNRVAAMTVVEVRDENGLPLEGAEVTFTLPPTGPGGSFSGQDFVFTTRTNVQGQAGATFMPNMQTGRFNIRVAAVLGNRTGHAVIAQTNALRSGVTEPKGGFFKFAWWKVAVLAGVGVTVGVLVTRGSSSSSVTLIPGTPTFGAP